MKFSATLAGTFLLSVPAALAAFVPPVNAVRSPYDALRLPVPERDVLAVKPPTLRRRKCAHAVTTTTTSAPAAPTTTAASSTSTTAEAPATTTSASSTTTAAEPATTTAAEPTTTTPATPTDTLTPPAVCGVKGSSKLNPFVYYTAKDNTVDIPTCKAYCMGRSETKVFALIPEQACACYDVAPDAAFTPDDAAVAYWYDPRC